MTGPQLLSIQVNGQRHEVPSGTSIEQLLQLLEVRARAVAVEQNLEVVPRAEHASRRLADGDRLEIVTLVGGG